MSKFFLKKKVLQQKTTVRIRPKLDFMLNTTLPTTFNNQMWQTISVIPPTIFMKNQEDIKNILLNDQKLFYSYFHRFYHNHQQISDWFKLANSNQLDLKNYIFNNLLSKKYKEYKDMIKENCLIQKYNKSLEVFRQEESKTKSKKKNNFHTIKVGQKSSSPLKKLESLKDDSSEKQLNLNESIKFKFDDTEIEKQDYHELFLKTFSACDGSKYIHYNFNKHRQGDEEKKKYNNFIRAKKIPNISSSPHNFEPSPRSIIRSANVSIHTGENNFLHESQDQLKNMNYCSYSVSPLGEVEKQTYIKQLFFLKKSTGKLRKVKVDKKSSKFQIRKKKIL